MKVLVWIDTEGVSGIDDYRMLSPQLQPQAKRYVTQDVNAAVRGIRKAHAGATIHIFDGHSTGGNLLEDEIEPGCRLLGGGWMTTFLDMVRTGKVAEYDAVLLLGQHAAAGTVDGFMSHTNTGATGLRVNGKDAGEIPQVAWLFGHFGVPAVLVVGDEAAVREARALLPGIDCVSVKKATIHRGVAECMPLAEAHTLITEAATRTIEGLGTARPFVVKAPVQIEVLYATEEMANTATRFPRFERTSAQAVSYVADDYLEGWLAYNTGRTVVLAHQQADLLALLDDIEEVQARKRDYLARRRQKWLEEPPPFPPVGY